MKNSSPAIFLFLAIAFFLIACSGSTGTILATPTTSSPIPATDMPRPTTTTPAPNSLGFTELKYRLLANFPKIFFCDPDEYPVAHEVSDELVASRVAGIQKNPEEYQTILIHLGLQGVPQLSPEQMRLVYADSKTLNAIELTPGDTQFQFRLRVSQVGKMVLVIDGTITSNGQIQITKQQTAPALCPICLSASTLIDTPFGQIPVSEIRMGMLVWTADADGTRMIGAVVKTVQRPVSRDDLVVHLTLDDGRVLLASGRHPIFNGTPLGDLTQGDTLDGAHVKSLEWIPLGSDSTYDILPSGPTGAYWANGILLGSTLSRSFQPSGR